MRKRFKLSRKRSKKMFRKHAHTKHSALSRPVMRGGIRF